MTAFDKVNLAGYALAIAGLIYLMGVVRAPAMQSAQRVFLVLIVGMTAILAARTLADRASRRPRQLIRPYAEFVETFARMTSELTILLAILALVTAAFTITGVPTKVGFLMLEVAQVNLATMALVAFVFGYIVGLGLPPAPTYIIVAVVIAPFMITAGIDPWVVHFFAFLIAVFGELSPPTSLTAAVTSRIADAPFMATMFRAMEMCLPLFVLMIAVFAWPQLITEPGLSQLVPAVMVLLVTLGFIGSLHGSFAATAALDRLARLVTGVLAVALLFRPPLAVATVVGVAIVALVAVGWLRTRQESATGAPAA